MANIGQIYYNVLDTASGTFATNPAVDIYTDILPQYDGGVSRLTKVGIQAPSGTKVVMNGKNIMVGRTGIYELDEDITITSLYFIKPVKYIKDEAATQRNLQEGAVAMRDAESTKEQSLATLNSNPEYIPIPVQPGNNETDEGREQKKKYDDYWQSYRDIQTTYLNDYNLGLAKYNKGKNGVYILDPLSSSDDLQNVIIDFIYEK